MNEKENGVSWQVIDGDCLDVLRGLPSGSVDAIVTDPPYGINHDTDYRRFSGWSGRVSPRKSRRFPRIVGDASPFNPQPWLTFPKVVLFGSTHFAASLPNGTTLIWDKRRPSQTGKFLSDAEVAWMKGGHGVYIFRHHWYGLDRASERGEKTLHPTQKPVALLDWVIGRLRLPEGATVLDPYCGSGSTGVAAIRRGLNFIGVQIVPEYAAIARARIAAAVADVDATRAAAVA